MPAVSGDLLSTSFVMELKQFEIIEPFAFTNQVKGKDGKPAVHSAKLIWKSIPNRKHFKINKIRCHHYSCDFKDVMQRHIQVQEQFFTIHLPLLAKFGKIQKDQIICSKICASNNSVVCQ